MNDTREVGRDSVVAARAAHFRTSLRGTGGPPMEVDAGLDTLDAWWKWFLNRFRLSRSPTPERDLQRAGTAPEWYELRPLPAKELGLELVLMLDGLAAHVADLLRRAEPDSVWVREKDAWFSQPISKLKLPGRPSIPVDIVVFDLAHAALKGDDIARRPVALRDVIERCLAIGDPRPRLFSALSRTEAKQLLSEVIAEHQRRTDQLLTRATTTGGPSSELDFTVDSLVPLWRWLVKRHHLPKVAATDAEIRRHDPPWWYDFWPRYAVVLGPDLSTLATSVGDYAAVSLMRAVPGSDWALGDDRLADLRQPILRLGGRVPVSIHEDVLRLVYGSLSGDKRAKDPTALHAMVLRRVLAAQTAQPDHTADSTPYRVISISDEPFDYQITLTDEVAWDEETAASFVRNLRGNSRLETVIHEDREVILIRTQSDEQAFREIAAVAWDQTSVGKGHRQ